MSCVSSFSGADYVRGPSDGAELNEGVASGIKPDGNVGLSKGWSRDEKCRELRAQCQADAKQHSPKILPALHLHRVLFSGHQEAIGHVVV